MSAQTSEATHYVKVKANEERRWSFMARGGNTTYLRVHALRFTLGQAEAFAAEIRADNPDFEAKAVPLRNAGRKETA